MLRYLIRRLPWWLVGNPFELLIGWLCVFAGIPLAAGAAPGSPVERLLPAISARLFGGTLSTGGVLITVGVVLSDRSPRQHIMIERAGLSLLGAAACGYGTAILAVAPVTGLPNALIDLGFAAACVLRYALLGTAAAVVREQVATHEDVVRERGRRRDER